MRNLNKLITLFFLSFIFTCCSEEEFGKNYDINLPVSSIKELKPVSEYIDGESTIYGENLDVVTSIYLGNIACDIVEATPTTLTFKIPRSGERNKVSITNKFKKTAESEQSFTPLYYDVEIQKWPTMLKKGGSFILEGKNIDLITKVMINGVEVSRSGAPTIESATYSLADLELSETAIIVVKTRTNQELQSPNIAVISQ